MSTYWYLCCKQCKTSIPFWGRYVGGSMVLRPASDDPEKIQDFLDEHSTCYDGSIIEHQIVVLDEHKADHYGYTCPWEEEDEDTPTAKVTAT